MLSRYQQWHRKHRLYNVWCAIKQRTGNPRCRGYPDYGGRGINMDPLWFKSFGDFALEVSTLPGYMPGLQLDRKNNSLGYLPGNVRWSNRKEQARNRRDNRIITFNGESHPMVVWAERIGVSNEVLFHRLGKLKWPLEKALTTPLFKGRRKANERGVYLDEVPA